MSEPWQLTGRTIEKPLVRSNPHMFQANFENWEKLFGPAQKQWDVQVQPWKSKALAFLSYWRLFATCWRRALSP